MYKFHIHIYSDWQRYNWLSTTHLYSDSPKKFYETDIIKMFEILVGVFFKRQSTFVWVLNVLHCSPNCSFIRTRQTLYRGL